MINISTDWETAYPGAALGILSMRSTRPQGKSPEFNAKRESLENDLREKFKSADRSTILNIPEMAAYTAYYKRFRKTYHLLLQLESVAQKNIPVPQTVPLVQAMFLAELNSFLLTAGHDLDHIHGSVGLDVSRGNEKYIPLRGEEVTCKRDDMVMFDAQSAICSVIRGQDRRTMITKKTDNVLYVVYVPPGIRAKAIEDHLTDLAENVTLVSPQSNIDFQHIYHDASPQPDEG
jgi:DNA/RNA-binding domain of Phe-tRNA-synthetase-like protein